MLRTAQFWIDAVEVLQAAEAEATAILERWRRQPTGRPGPAQLE